MRIRAAVLALAILTGAYPLPAATVTVDEVVRLVRDAAGQHQSDGDLARALHRIEVSKRLDDRTAIELESLAPGPESAFELRRMQELSRYKPLPKALPSFPSPPGPTMDELRAALEAARRKALSYTATLPDFICTETVRRYDDNLSWGRSTLLDTLTVQLTYFEHREKYKLAAVNGRASKLSYEDVSGAWSKGEFGSMLLDVFSPASRAVFAWSDWITLRKRPAYVLSFRIEAKNSRYRLYVAQATRANDSVAVGEHGLVYIDRETRDVMRLESEADSIPGGFALAAATRTLDYGLAEVGGRTFLLPLRAEVAMTLQARPLMDRNELDFGGYRKFAGESTISFGDSSGETPAPAPVAGK